MLFCGFAWEIKRDRTGGGAFGSVFIDTVENTQTCNKCKCICGGEEIVRVREVAMKEQSCK